MRGGALSGNFGDSLSYAKVPNRGTESQENLPAGFLAIMMTLSP